MDYLQDIFQELHGPGKFRFIIQPMIAILLGIRDGRRDARGLNPPFFLNLIHDPERRSEIGKSVLKAVIKPLILAWLMDIIFQLVILHHWNPSQAMLVGLVLVVLPYMLTRGISNRLISIR